MSEQEGSAFALVYEGAKDEDPATLSRIKGVFIADLELSIPEVQNILQSLPAVIKQSDDEVTLEPFRKVLARAGAKVMIVQLRATPVPEHVAEDDEGAVFELSLEDLGLAGMVRSPQRESAPVYELPETDITGSLEEVLSQADQSTHSQVPIDTAMSDLSALTTDHPQSRQEVISEPIGTVVTVVPETAAPEELVAEAPSTSQSSVEMESNQPIGSEEPSSPSPSPEPQLATDSSALQFAAGDEAPTEDREKVAEPTPAPSPIATGLEFEDMSASLAAPLPVEPAPAPVEDSAIKSDGLDLFGALEELKHGATEPELSNEMDQSALKADEQSLEMDSAKPPDAPLSTTPDSTPPAQEEVQPLLNRPLASQHSEVQKPNPTVTDPSPSVAKAPAPRVIEHRVQNAHPRMPSSSRRTLPLDVIVTVLVGGVLLGIANWYYFGSSIQPSAPENTSTVEEVVEESPTPKVTLRSSPKITPLEFQGTSKWGVLTAKVTFFGGVGVIYTGAVHLSTEAPPDLTPEEIVRDIIRPPWASRVQLYDLSFARDESGSFVANGPAKITIEYKGRKIRAAGAGLVRISFPVSPNVAKAYIEVKDVKELTSFTTTTEGIADVVATSDNTFSFHFMTSVDAALKSPPPTSVPTRSAE